MVELNNITQTKITKNEHRNVNSICRLKRPMTRPKKSPIWLSLWLVESEPHFFSVGLSSSQPVSAIPTQDMETFKKIATLLPYIGKAQVEISSRVLIFSVEPRLVPKKLKLFLPESCPSVKFNLWDNSARLVYIPRQTWKWQENIIYMLLENCLK